MSKKIDAIKHSTDTRAAIPSSEEAGYEDANETVQEGNKTLDLPKNPIVHRGDDPELFWLNKYGNDDRDDLLRVDIRSLYRHEHIAPETLISGLYKVVSSAANPSQSTMFSVNEMFGNALDRDELDKISQYYRHQNGWTNRLVQGDSLLVMASLLEREGMAGQVQTIYIDPPYGIKYGGNWQIKLNNRDVKDGNDEALTGEPEQIKAFRDTWELGIHSYLSYLRDRLLVAKELLTESGSCFVQISDENVHLVRNIMDEIFGSENFVSQLYYQKTTGAGSPGELVAPPSVGDYILWYAKSYENKKYRKIYKAKNFGGEGTSGYKKLELPNGERMTLAQWEKINNEKFDEKLLSKGYRVFTLGDLTSQSGGESSRFPIELRGKIYTIKKGSWKTNQEGIKKLIAKKRIDTTDSGGIGYVRYYDDFPYVPVTNLWTDTVGQNQFGGERTYVVQTALEVIQRCILMTTDPGDLVLDPTCGSGTTAFVAEQWGRRWITIDTSRIAINIAKQRLMTAIFPFYKLYDEQNRDIRQGFVYKTVPHITLKSLANDEPPATETLYDKPEEDKNILRVSGAFTVETLQNYEPTSPADLDNRQSKDSAKFEEVIRQHLLSSGIKNGRKEEMVVFKRIDFLGNEYLHAEGYYQTARGEEKAYFHIGPKFGTVSKKSASEATKECRLRGDANWLVILGFSFESDIEGKTQTTSMGNFEVTKARIHDDLLQEGLKKRPAKSAASFVTIGEPDVEVVSVEGLGNSEKQVQVEIKGLDIYDPIKDEIKARNIADIAYWMLDEDYDGSNFVVKQVFFCGGDGLEFGKWRKALEGLSGREKTKKAVEMTLKIEIDEEAFDRLYGHTSHPIPIRKKGQKIAVRIVSQFGEESTKVLEV